MSDQYDSYYTEIAIAVIVSLIIFGAILLTRIRYGEFIITNLTLRPYVIALILLSVMLIGNCIQEYYVTVVYKNDYKMLVEHFIYTKALKITFFVFSQLKILLAIEFIRTRSFETQILNYFVWYQRQLRLQNLDVARDHYQKREKQMHRAYNAGSVIVCIFPVVAQFLVFYGDG